jgi:hypothetical protein
MKKYMVILATMAFVIVMASWVYAANTTQTVGATATILTMCANGTNGTLAFGPIDPSGSSTVSATGANLAYKCSKGTTFSVTGISGPNGETATTCSASPCTFVGVMKSTAVGTDTLGYTLSITTYNGYAGTGFGAAVSIPFTGTVTQAQFQNAVPHADYAETVTITITY